MKYQLKVYVGVVFVFLGIWIFYDIIGILRWDNVFLLWFDN